MLNLGRVDDVGLFPSKKCKEKTEQWIFHFNSSVFSPFQGAFLGAQKKREQIYATKTMVNLSGTPPSDELKNWRMATLDVILCDNSFPPSKNDHPINPS